MSPLSLVPYIFHHKNDNTHNLSLSLCCLPTPHPIDIIIELQCFCGLHHYHIPTIILCFLSNEPLFITHFRVSHTSLVYVSTFPIFEKRHSRQSTITFKDLLQNYVLHMSTGHSIYIRVAEIVSLQLSKINWLQKGNSFKKKKHNKGYIFIIIKSMRCVNYSQ